MIDGKTKQSNVVTLKIGYVTPMKHKCDTSLFFFFRFLCGGVDCIRKALVVNGKNYCIKNGLI